MLLINLAAALFCAASITASPTAPQYEALAERDVAGTELESRTFWRNDGECKDWWRNKLCRLKGRYWSCNAHCECVYNPPEKQCHEWVKHDCENRAKTNLRLWFDPKECKCVDRGCPQEHKDKCLHEGGTYNDHECKCTPKPTCPEHVKKECEARQSPRFEFNQHECKCVDKGCPQEHKNKCLHEGGTYNDHECKCTPKPACPEHVKRECEARQSPRFEFNQHECKCVDKGCPREHKEKCLHEGGTYNDHECKCTPKPACPEHVKQECEARKSPRFEFNQHECKCIDKGCPREHKEKCLHEGGTYNDHECKCTPKPACPEHVKQECEARKGPRFEFNQHECKCIDKGCPREHKEKCLHEGGTYNDHECKCTDPPPTCRNEHKKRECEQWGGNWNVHECKCAPKEHEPCKEWKKVLLCKKLGKGCNDRCRCN